MKNRKRKICPKCSSILKLEKNKHLKREYKYICYICDENFYEIEAIKTTKKRK